MLKRGKVSPEGIPGSNGGRDDTRSAGSITDRESDGDVNGNENTEFESDVAMLRN